jgi:hypothetical protein
MRPLRTDLSIVGATPTENKYWEHTRPTTAADLIVLRDFLRGVTAV